MSDLLPLDIALEHASEFAFDGEWVAVVVHGAPEHIQEDFFTDLQDVAEARLTLTMPPLFWATYVGYAVNEFGEYDRRAAVEVMTPEYFDETCRDASYDSVIDAEFPASTAERS